MFAVSRLQRCYRASLIRCGRAGRAPMSLPLTSVSSTRQHHLKMLSVTSRTASRAKGLIKCPRSRQRILVTGRLASTKSTEAKISQSKTQESQSSSQNNATATTDARPPKKKTQAEADEELRLKLEGISGGGGEAGLEVMLSVRSSARPMRTRQ